jgi:hypothetical protein
MATGGKRKNTRSVGNHPLLVILRSEATKNLLLRMKECRFLPRGCGIGMTDPGDFYPYGGPKDHVTLGVK